MEMGSLAACGYERRQVPDYTSQVANHSLRTSGRQA